MDSIYENVADLHSITDTVGKRPQNKGNPTQKQEKQREDPSSKWSKVFLIILSVSLAFALGGVCALWILYVNKIADFESRNEQYIMVSKQLLAQEKNNIIMMKELEELKSNYSEVTEQLLFNAAQSCNISLGGWISCLGKLYFFSSGKLNWSCSQDDCVSKGANLVTITSKQEQEFLVSKINMTHWIGLNDLDTEGHWVWVNNQTLDTQVQFWFSVGQREPDNWKEEDPLGENCASLGDHLGNYNTWFDASCKKHKRYICERNINLTPSVKWKMSV
ncbi:CD209 antigen-like protein E isoform X1 [Myxocyprinus asiaticus]|uniref:CD209 antigen-like protein E isoform X1 n=1 Tax=Myxocyprinus asiaticus TaxID=70543 RepID=UPI0022217A1E|nr:CD209 antigen-like protein E isoform X1 [Myxocyprinus asiaticus]